MDRTVLDSVLGIISSISDAKTKLVYTLLLDAATALSDDVKALKGEVVQLRETVNRISGGQSGGSSSKGGFSIG